MNEGKIVVGIDVGTSKVVTLIARMSEFVNVLGVSEVVSSGIRKGQIVDIEAAVSSIHSSLEAAERMAGFSASHVAVSIGGGQIESQNSRGVVAVSGQGGEITQNDVARVIDAAKAISMPSSRQTIHVLPRSYVVDGQEGIKDPIGMSGVRLEVNTHIISANSVSLRNIEKAVSEVGVDIDGFVSSGYASSLSVLTETEKELGVVLVDMGAGTCDISIYVDGSVAYSSVLAIGARHITNDLAIGLRISLESAEKIKLFLSEDHSRKVIHPQGGEEKTSKKEGDDLDLSELNLSEEVRKVSQKTLIDGIIRPRLNEIFTMIGLEIKKSELIGQTPSGIVVTGGGSLTVGAKDSAKRMLAMPVRVGTPQGLKGIIDEAQHPSYATAVGLAIYGSRFVSEKQLPFGLSLPKIPMMGGNKAVRKITDFIKSFIP